jgi:hypothetical protein
MGAGRRRLTAARALVARLLYAALAGMLLFAAAELLNSESTGPWLELAGIACLGLAVVTSVLALRTSLLRRREGESRRAWGWAVAAVGSALAGLAALVALAILLPVEPTLSGADVSLTRPILHDLPVPPGASLVGETPGPRDTESIRADYQIPDLARAAAFYRQALPAAGWSAEDSSATGSVMQYRKSNFIVIVVIDLSGPAAGDYSVTVDRVPVPLASPTPSP